MLTGGSTPAFVNVPTPSVTNEWFHVVLDINLSDSDAGSISITLGDRSAMAPSVQTAPGPLSAVNLGVGIDSYVDPTTDASTASFVAHIDNVVVTQ